MPVLALIIGFALVILLTFSIHSFNSKRGVLYLNYILFLVLFGRFGQALVFLLIDNGLITRIPVLLKLFCPLYYAAPALVYLYTVGFVNNRTALRKTDYLHFIPAIIAIIDDIPWYFSPSVNWDKIISELVTTKDISVVTETGLFPAEIYLYARPVMFTIYLILSFNVLFKSELFKKGQGSRTKRIWILACLTTVSVFQVLYVMVSYFRHNGLLFDDNSRLYILLAGISVVLFLAMVLILIHNPRILYGYILVSVGEKNKIIEMKPAKVAIKPASVKGDADQDLMQSVQNYMILEKPYLNSDFQIIHLAHYFNMPTHQCSIMINSLIGKNFRDWINYYRIEYFIKTYPEKASKLTIDAIAFESGFNSMTTFYRAFKKETGKMPSNYFKLAS